ncbi:MAG: phenylalanine--tRNA ligase subunit beta [bacterium]|nr:phenylalanine--tRNA ligase subunit beta [bacterium]
MLVCWDWLNDYVKLTVDPDEMALKFAMSGLNHESTERVGSDVVIDLEVTSNRGDCLGHIGVAREAAVLLGEKLKLPEFRHITAKLPTNGQIEVENHFLDACPEYTARIIRGVRVGPSPEWLVRRLNAVGINSVNNVVDITNYVMMECGQPLHAFDLKHVRGGKIVVRPAADKEKFEAIDHKTYELDPQMVVIADAQRALALGGVMGGVESEVSESTVDLLIEAARFSPLAIRRAARKLKLHSPSSYRFERVPDPAGLDWASMRCCDLILELAGGELVGDVVRGGIEPAEREPIEFRVSQVARILGIQVPLSRIADILSALGCHLVPTEESPDENVEALQIIPPTWRMDIQRECDLIEEVARMYGYEQIPEDVAVPIGVASPRAKDIALTHARTALSAYGVDEAMTPSVVSQALESWGSLWTDNPPLTVDTALLEGARSLRRSLIPSLLAARYNNQTQSIRNAELYEVATIYLPRPGKLPAEQSTLGMVTQGDIRRVKGVVEQIIFEVVGSGAQLSWKLHEHTMLEPGSGLKIELNGELLGFVGVIAASVQKNLSLDLPVAAAELSVDRLTEHLRPVRRAEPVSLFPAISRDLNFVVDESTHWADLEAACIESGGQQLNRVEYRETYRDPSKDGSDKKRVLLTVFFQSLERTLTGDEVDVAVNSIIENCTQKLSAKLLA